MSAHAIGPLPWLAAALAAALALPACAAGPVADVEVGRRIYEEGTLPGGEPLHGVRWDAIVVSGAQAACVLCHRPSGMGAVEGDIQAPPVTGHALFGTDKVIANMDPRSGKAFNLRHDPYTEASLARALREGRHASGEAMHVMMPRYRLDDFQMASLVAYLRQLSTAWSPGVTDEVVRLATVVTPGVDAERRALFRDMMTKALAQKNASTALPTKRGARRHMAGAAEFVLGTERKWDLQIWELAGAPDTWGAQLDAFYRREPVFALVSGLGSETWEPVDEFCERTRLPCWFPSVDLPPEREPRYTLYFSRGVALEAQVLAAHLLAADRPKTLVQVFRDDYVGRGAARTLAAALAGSGVRVEDRPLAAGDAAALAQALGGLGAQDAVMLWLRPGDLALLGGLETPAAKLYLSTQLGEAERGHLPASWRAAARLVYPYELPERRRANLAYFDAWLKQRRIPLVDEAMQSEVYFALAFLTDSLTEMLDNLYRDYLIERAENMIGRREGGRAEAEVLASTAQRRAPATRQAGGAAEPTPLQRAGMSSVKREGTTVYPRLSLGPGQRHASKGGYIARFEQDRLLPVSEWIVP